MKPSAISSVFAGTRHSRSSSVGSDALKRLSKALPSLSFPSASSFLPNRSSTHFFSSSSGPSHSNTFPQTPGSTSSTSKKSSPRSSPTRATYQVTHKTPQPPQSPQQRPSTGSGLDPNSFRRRHTSGLAAAPRTASPAAAFPGTEYRPTLTRPPSGASRPSYGLRRTTSDESLLYQTLSRVPSHGDEREFEHIREQVNSRVKAIMDSFDRPSFRMPQLPSTSFCFSDSFAHDVVL